MHQVHDAEWINRPARVVEQDGENKGVEREQYRNNAASGAAKAAI